MREGRRDGERDVESRGEERGSFLQRGSLAAAVPYKSVRLVRPLMVEGRLPVMPDPLMKLKGGK